MTLEMLARQLERVLDRQGAMEDQIAVLTSITMRIDSTVGRLAQEVNGLYRMIDRMQKRLAKLED